MTRMRARRGASNLGLPLMLVTFVLMGGFLYWLFLNAVPAPEAELSETETAADQEIVATDADITTLEEAPGTYEGQMVRVSNVVASSGVGSEAFFIELPRTPFLVKLGPELVAAGVTVPSGNVTVVGRLVAMTDSIIDAWTTAGSISSGDAPIVGFATHFIEAQDVEVGAAGDAQGEGSDEMSGAGV